MEWKRVVGGVVLAVVLSALGLFWHWTSGGGFVHALGGITQTDLDAGLAKAQTDLNAGLAKAKTDLDAGLAQIKDLQAAVAFSEVPAGAVMAFSLETTHCPTGWTQFGEGVGRTIIGKGAPLASNQKFGIDAKGRALKIVDWQHGGEILVADLRGASPNTTEVNKMNIVPWVALVVCEKPRQ